MDVVITPRMFKSVNTFRLSRYGKTVTSCITIYYNMCLLA